MTLFARPSAVGHRVGARARRADLTRSEREKAESMEATFASDKRRPGSWLARVAVTESEQYPDEGSEIEVRRRDGSTCRVLLGRCVWAGPDGEREGIDVAIYQCEGLEPPKGRQPPKRMAPNTARKGR